MSQDKFSFFFQEIPSLRFYAWENIKWYESISVSVYWITYFWKEVFFSMRKSIETNATSLIKFNYIQWIYNSSVRSIFQCFLGRWNIETSKLCCKNFSTKIFRNSRYFLQASRSQLNLISHAFAKPYMLWRQTN